MRGFRQMGRTTGTLSDTNRMMLYRVKGGQRSSVSGPDSHYGRPSGSRWRMRIRIQEIKKHK